MKLRVSGSGSALVLLHGFCETGIIWHDVANALSADYLIIVPDLPGFGETEASAESLEEWAVSLHQAILPITKNNKITLIGHSMGGYVALAFAELFPDMVAALGLFHSAVLQDTPEKKENRYKTIDFINNYGVKPFVKEIIPGIYAPDAPKQWIEKSMEIALNLSKEGIIKALKAMAERPDRTVVLKNLTVPILVVAGKYDGLIPLQTQAEQALLAEKSQFVILENSGHMGIFEEAEKSLLALTQFMHWVHSK